MPIVPQGRVCTHCGEWKPASEFKRVSGHPDRLRSWCHVCTLARQQAYRDKRVVRVCSDCGAQYECRNGESRYCDPCGTARRFANLEQGEKMRLVCRRCGIKFPSDRSNKQYCSNACKRSALKGKPNAKRGRHYPQAQRATTRICPGCGNEFRGVKDTKRKKQRYCSHRCYLRCRRVSHFENRVMDMIEAAGCKIERQAKRGRWSFDGAIIGTPILIEADGAYWHSSAAVQERDARKGKWASQNGYTLMRVLELEFYKDEAAAIAPILRRAEAEGLTVERADN